MTQPVPTNGFITPPQGGSPANPQLPPTNPVEGWVAPPNPAGNPPAPTAAPAQPAAPDLTAAIAALQAALAKPTTPAAPAPGTPAPNDNTTFDDPILKSMAAVIRTSAKGIDLDRVLGKAIEYGDANLIDKAYLAEKGGEASAELLTIAQGIVEAVNARSAATTTEVYALAGSEANWNACVAAFNQGAAPELKAVITQMLDSGKTDQIKASAKLVVEFAKSNGTVPTNAGLIANGGAAPLLGQGISKAEFQSELQKLNPQDRDFVAKRSELYGRRQAGKQQGK